MTILTAAGLVCLLALVIRRWITPCSHQERLWAHGRLECMHCGHAIDVLPQAVVKGPAHDPSQARGVPAIWAKTVRKDNVREFQRQSER